MTIKINYLKKTTTKSTGNIILFTDEKFSTNGLKKNLSNSEFTYINDLLKSNDKKKKIICF